MDSSTDRISKLFTIHDPNVKKETNYAVKGFRIPLVKHHLLLKPKPAEVRVREIRALKQISEADSMLFSGAVEANRCIEEHDLHLFNAKKNFTEKFHRFHNVMNLKLPRVVISKDRLRLFVDQVIKDRHNIKILSKEKKANLQLLEMVNFSTTWQSPRR